MIIEDVKWEDVKVFAESKKVSIQYIEREKFYTVYSIDHQLAVRCTIIKADPVEVGSEQEDFETNYKSEANSTIHPTDSDGSLLTRTKITNTGWSYQLHAIEFETSKLDSIYSKKVDGTDWGFTTIKCYDDEGGELTTQLQCDTQAVKTVIDWEPTFDYEIVGGLYKLESVVGSNVRLWVVGIPDVPAEYGGSKEFISSLNLKYIAKEEGIRVDGRAPKLLKYDPQLHTNKLRIILTHPVGYKHDFSMIFEIFRA